MKEPKFGTWTAPECALRIEYSLAVIDEIRTIVTEGFQRLSRGGIEVGGVLYGRVDANHLRILAMRPIACEHAGGPTFNLSDNDRAALAAQLQQTPEDFELQSLTPVGWFCSAPGSLDTTLFTLLSPGSARAGPGPVSGNPALPSTIAGCTF